MRKKQPSGFLRYSEIGVKIRKTSFKLLKKRGRAHLRGAALEAASGGGDTLMRMDASNLVSAA
jgi:hypothetical protein